MIEWGPLKASSHADWYEEMGESKHCDKAPQNRNQTFKSPHDPFRPSHAVMKRAWNPSWKRAFPRIARSLLCLGWLVLIHAQECSTELNKTTYRTAAINQPGDAQKGKQWFHAEGATACIRCHSLDGSASKAGPDLSTVGESHPREDLIESILYPSRHLAIGYATHRLERVDGETIQGILKDQSESHWELMGADGQRQTIPTSSIAEHSISTTSLMPEGLELGMQPQDFSDLVAYLVSLKRPVASKVAMAGMPDAIPLLDPPVKLEPLFEEADRFPHAFVEKPGDIRYGLTGMEAIPGTSGQFMVHHQKGELWWIDTQQEPQARHRFADFSQEVFFERGPNGLLGLAFHPDFAKNGLYYLKHQVLEANQIVTVVVEKMALETRHQDSGKPSRRLVGMTSITQNHSGGCLQFGPDGYLYIGMGDTGPQRDPRGHGQDLGTLLGKILRIDVRPSPDGKPYRIPQDNPFVGLPGVQPEIWAYGFREPWRFAFDALTQELWVGDVGQDRVEEVAVVMAGENHGWNVMEGFEPFSQQYRREGENYVAPVFAYHRDLGNSVTGGQVYRAEKTSPFYGMYVFGDYTSRRIWALAHKERRLERIVQIGTSPMGIASFATDAQGEVYLVGYEGMIYRLELESLASTL